jgi:hypothetical protein
VGSFMVVSWFHQFWNVSRFRYYLYVEDSVLFHILDCAPANMNTLNMTSEAVLFKVELNQVPWVIHWIIISSSVWLVLNFSDMFRGVVGYTPGQFLFHRLYDGHVFLIGNWKIITEISFMAKNNFCYGRSPYTMNTKVKIINADD